MRAPIRLVGLTSVALFALVAGEANAQRAVSTPPDSAYATGVPTGREVNPNTDRRLEDQSSAALEPVGARFGSFVALPKVEAGLIYDSNIYGLERETDDFIAKVSPSLTINGDLGTYTTTIRLALDNYNYFSRTNEDRLDYAIGGNHRLELASQTFLNANAAFSHNHEDRGDPNSGFTTRKPIAYDLYELGAGFTRDLSTLRFGVNGGLRRYDFKDSTRIIGGILNNDDRDRNQYNVGVRVGAELSPGYAIVARFGYDKVDYDNTLDDAGFARSNDGIRASLGVGFELTRLLTGEVFGGYLSRKYDDPRFDKISSVLFGAAVSWFPTELTTVRLNVDRSVEETVILGYRGYLASSVGVNVEHELLRTLTLTGGVRYAYNKYERSTLVTVPKRSDDNYGLSLALRYILNRNVYTSLGYDYSARNSTETTVGSDFKRHKVLATVGVQF